MNNKYFFRKNNSSASLTECGPLCQMSIGIKLNMGFGVLVLVTLVVVTISIVSSKYAARDMEETADMRTPSTLASSRAQAELLKMVADVRGYLALSEEHYRNGYYEARKRFEKNLSILDSLMGNSDQNQGREFPVDHRNRLLLLKKSFTEWSRLPDQLFKLHGDQLEREPGLRVLIKECNRPIAQIVVVAKKMIETQKQREPTPDNIQLMGEMASFQGSFYAMVAGLRGYATTGRNNFKFEYTTNLAINQRALNRLQTNEASLSSSQKRQIQMIIKVLEQFIMLPDKIFEWVEGERRRMDLFLFRTKAVPLSDSMLETLRDITSDQQNLLQSDLSKGRENLGNAQQIILITGIIATILALIFAYAFRANIVGPVRRLTRVAQVVGAGDLTITAPVESRDEIGTLAGTFNDMTGKLGATLKNLEKSSELIKKMFGRYLSTEVMNSLLEDPSGLELGGDRRKVTIMMTDLRGFTALSERLKPEQVVKMLNLYFDVMVDVILKYHGNINEIIGDALLVIFGAPQDMPDRTQQAIACAIEMQNAMTIVNERIRTQGLPEIEMGIGLNETDVVVGNIGTSKRSKYAVVGSGVNMTSRIESYSVGGQILVSESIYHKIHEKLRIESQREVFPKGAETSLKIFEIGGIAGEYNLYLEHQDPSLVKLSRPVLLRYTVLEGKSVENIEFDGSFVKLSKRCAEIIPKKKIHLLSNIKMNLMDVDEILSKKNFYGKIVEHNGLVDSGQLVQFTSIPPEVSAYFQAFLKHSLD